MAPIDFLDHGFEKKSQQEEINSIQEFYIESIFAPHGIFFA
jgi:hypothetical protein